MSETSEWHWQGFLGKMADAIAAKIEMDASPLAGAWLPQRGDTPFSVDKNAEWGMFAIMVPKNTPITAQTNMIEMDAAQVGRMVGG
jgi:hypothetical protein